MPTFEVETNCRDPQLRRRFAKTVSVWLARQGVPINHVLVKFREIDSDEIFSGPYPFAQFPNAAGPASFAYVTCYLSRERSDRFREQLATLITDAFANQVPTPLIFILFRPVDPADFVIGAQKVSATGG